MNDVEVVIAPSSTAGSSRVISQDHRRARPSGLPILVRRRGHQLGLLVLGMGALRPAFLNRHLGGQNTIHRAFAAQVDLFVEQRGHHARRVSGPRTVSEHSVSKTSPRSVSLNARAGVGRGCCCPVDLGSERRCTTSFGRPPRCRARRFYTDVLSQLIGRLQEFVPSSRLIPSSPATFPCTSMIRCAFLSSFSGRAFRRSSLRTFSSSGFRSGLRPRFFDRAFRTRYAPPCARRQVRRVQALSPQELTHLAGLGAPVRFFDDQGSLYDGLNRRRSGLSTTSGSAGAAALRLSLPGSRGTTILFHSLSQSQHVRFLCLRPTLILCVLRVSRTLAERGSGQRRTSPVDRDAASRHGIRQVDRRRRWVWSCRVLVTGNQTSPPRKTATPIVRR